MRSVQANRDSEKLYSLITKLEDVFNRMLPTNTKILKNSSDSVKCREGTTIGKERTPKKGTAKAHRTPGEKSPTPQQKPLARNSKIAAPGSKHSKTRHQHTDTQVNR